MADLQSAVRKPPPESVPVLEESSAAANLNHARFGVDESAGGGVMLGRNLSLRSLGERAALPADWLTAQRKNVRDRAPYPDIADFQEAPAARDPLAEPIAMDSGYQITSDEVSRVDMNTSRVVFDKNVRMTSPQFNLTCDQLVVHLGSDKNTMQFSEAHGSVNILLTGVPPEKAYRGQSKDAVFDPRKNQIVLTGWPKVKGASQEQVAAESTTRMTLFTKTGKLLTEGRAQTRVTRSFVDESTGAPATKSKRQ